MPRLVTITTHPSSTNVLMRGQLAYLRGRGFDVVAIASPGQDLDDVAERERVDVIGVPMAREIHPLRDMVSLFRLYRAIRRVRPDIVNAGTSKAALLGLLAATAARVPVRVYTLRGLRLETVRGIKRRVLEAVEKLTAWCAHRIVCVSHSLRELYVDQGFAAQEKTAVLLSGSSNGVDAERMAKGRNGAGQDCPSRSALGIPEQAPVIGFVGRLVRDKGIVELLAAFDQLSVRWPEVRLLIVGDFEQGDALPASCVQRIREDERIVLVGFVKQTAPYYALMDVLAFPSHREGFPNVPLEAAAAELPVVGFVATGTVDAVVSGVTGTLVPRGDSDAFGTALEQYLADPQLRREHGRAGRERVLRDFRQEAIWEALIEQYEQLLLKNVSDA